MQFHVFAYLPFDNHQAGIDRLIAEFGVAWPYPPKANIGEYYKTPDDFRERLAQGIYTDFLDSEPNKPRPLAMIVATGEGRHQRFRLELAGVFSPERKRLSALADRTDAQEQTLNALKRATHTYIGGGGGSSAQPGQLALAEAGWVVVSLEGSIIPGTRHNRGDRDLDEVRSEQSEQRDAVIAMLRTLGPDYAFTANEDDYELWHMGPIKYFPPEEPWRYLWNFMFYGERRLSEADRATLLSAPATEVHALENAVALQTFNYHFHLGEVPDMDYESWGERACKLMGHLGVELPYDTFINVTGLSACNEKAEPLIKWSSPNN